MEIGYIGMDIHSAVSLFPKCHRQRLFSEGTTCLCDAYVAALSLILEAMWIQGSSCNQPVNCIPTFEMKDLGSIQEI